VNKATRWTVPADHPAFAGHFPGKPILPGAMLLDTVLHAISVASGIALDVCEINSVKFLSPASPGEVLLIQHRLAPGGTIHFDVVAGMRKIVSGSIVPGSSV
jgi:3-hydroxyacyl-[acyl-carrier-protein] dehydratase